MATDQKTIQSYNQLASSWAQHMRSAEKIAHQYLEKPAMYSLCQDISGKDILCIGCGTGEECNELKQMGANRVVGIDIAQNMIAIAQASFPTCEFYTMDMEALTFAPKSFDIVYASLALHYAKEWKETLGGIYTSLRTDGILLFSTQHPVTYNADILRDKEKTSYLLGYEKIHKDRSLKILGNYFDTDAHEKTWPGGNTIRYYNRSIEEMTAALLDANFSIQAIKEPKPIEAVKQIDPQFYAIHTKIPLFIIFLVKKIVR